MSGNLVNAFGKITLEETQLENRDLLILILNELRVMNAHMGEITDNEINYEDIKEANHHDY